MLGQARRRSFNTHTRERETRRWSGEQEGRKQEGRGRESQKGERASPELDVRQRAEGMKREMKHKEIDGAGRERWSRKREMEQEDRDGAGRDRRERERERES